MAGCRLGFGEEAEIDFVSILKRTKSIFGRHQANIYRASLLEAFACPENGPDILGSLAREEILAGARTLHIARNRRRGRHLILYRPTEGKVIYVIRNLHDAMDLQRHVPSGLKTGDP